MGGVYFWDREVWRVGRDVMSDMGMQIQAA